MKKNHLVALGEILIDFTFNGKSPDGNNLYQENTGGAPANCVSCLCKLGGKGAFIGCTGKDSFGEDVRKTLKSINVDTKEIQYTESQHTTLAFVTLSETGERSFSFCRNPGADTQIDFDTIDKSCLEDTKIFHIGSLSLTDEPAATCTIKAIEKAKKAGVLISYDPNWREALWKGKKDTFEKIKSLFNYADIVKVSDEEVFLLYGKNIDYKEGAEKIHSQGVRLVFITLGKDGAFYSYKNKDIEYSGIVKGFDVKTVDTTGAGDSFFGGILYCLTRRNDIFDFDEKTLAEYVRFGNAVAALCVSKKGAIPALPDIEEVKSLLK